jgi:UDP-GlcNAc:undecaprenyl-phosphate GlcNAc-1-phosphate transferase
MVPETVASWVCDDAATEKRAANAAESIQGRYDARFVPGVSAIINIVVRDLGPPYDQLSFVFLQCYGVLWSQKAATMLGMTAPLIALSVPLLDTGLAIFRRFLRRQPIFGADRGHIHHRLLDKGLTQRKVALTLYACSAVGAACSILMMNKNATGIVILIFCLMSWIGVQHLGYIEFGVAGRMFIEGAFRRLLNSQIALQTYEERLNAATTAEEFWHVMETAF